MVIQTVRHSDAHRAHRLEVEYQTPDYTVLRVVPGIQTGHMVFRPRTPDVANLLVCYTAATEYTTNMVDTGFAVNYTMYVWSQGPGAGVHCCPVYDTYEQSSIFLQLVEHVKAENQSQ